MKSKKMVAALVAAALSLGTATVGIALEYYSPSKSVADLASTQTSDPTVSLNVDTNSEEYKAADEAAKAQVEEMLKYADNIEEYFTKIDEDGEKTIDGMSVLESITAIIGTDDAMQVNEVGPFVVDGWDESKGDMEFTISFPTKYVEDAEVAFAIRIVDPETGEVTWAVVKGVGQKDGSVKIELDVETLKAIQGKLCTYAVACTEDAVVDEAAAA